MEKPEASDESLAALFKDGINPLPDWERMEEPFERIEVLDMSKAEKDKIILWWKENSRQLTRLAKLKQVSGSINLPRNEAVVVSRTYQESLASFKKANERLLEFVGGKRSAFRAVADLYLAAFGTAQAEQQATEVKQAIEDFENRKENIDLKTEVAAAMIDTRSENPDDNSFRIKAAQHVLDEIFHQLAIGRVMAVNDVAGEISEVIDSPKTERVDLTSTFLSKPWTGEERQVRSRQVNRLRRVLEKLGGDTADKIGLNTLWRWAKGELPQDANVFKILEYANELDIGITRTVAEAWQAEAERKEDDDE